MSVKLCISLLCFAFFLVQCDSKPAGVQNSTPASTPSVASAPVAAASGETKTEAGAGAIGAAAEPALDACGLIEKSEVESVQSGKVKGTVPSKRDDASLVIAQCYYTVFSADGTKDLSVHLEVTASDPKGANPNALRDLWQERFEGGKGSKKKEKPTPVQGLGEGAFWVGNNRFGALYVLKNQKLLRISIGGPGEEGEKIEKSKTLAEKALKRLS